MTTALYCTAPPPSFSCFTQLRIVLEALRLVPKNIHIVRDSRSGNSSCAARQAPAPHTHRSDVASGESNGFAFVDFESVEDCTAVVTVDPPLLVSRGLAARKVARKGFRAANLAWGCPSLWIAPSVWTTRKSAMIATAVVGPGLAVVASVTVPVHHTGTATGVAMPLGGMTATSGATYNNRIKHLPMVRTWCFRLPNPPIPCCSQRSVLVPRGKFMPTWVTCVCFCCRSGPAAVLLVRGLTPQTNETVV